MNEADVKRALVENIKERGGYARRIEDAFGVGFPDLVVQTSANYPVFFIEAKLILTGHTFGPSPRQYIELKRLAISRYSHPMLAGFSVLNKRWYLHPHAESAHVTRCFAQMPDVDFFDTLQSYYDKYRSDK